MTMGPYKTEITGSLLNSDDNFRSLFVQLMRAAHPYLAPGAYFSDLLYDAATTARMDEGETIYMLVRQCGTNMFTDGLAAIRLFHKTDGAAVLRLTKTRYGLNIDLIYDGTLHVDNLK